MTGEQLEALLRDPDPRPFWPTAKPRIGAAREAVRKAEDKAGRALLEAHLEHYRALRGAVEDRCGEEGGHEVAAVGGPESLGDRSCVHCGRHFPRWTPCGPRPPETADGGASVETGGDAP